MNCEFLIDELPYPISFDDVTRLHLRRGKSSDIINDIPKPGDYVLGFGLIKYIIKRDIIYIK